MAPEQATQTEDAFRSYYSPQAAPAPPPNAAGFGPSTPYAMYPTSYGQPIQPYHPAPPILVVNKNWEIVKLTLHGLSIVFGICALATSLSMLGSAWVGPIFAVCSAPVGVACIIWSLAELITRFVRKWKSGIHPGAHVGLCLLIWLAAAFTSGIESTYLATIEDGYDEGPNTQCWNSRTQDFGDCDRNRYYQGRRAVALAACAFTSLLWLVHFILFVGACIDTSKRNAANKRTVVYYPPAAYYGGPAPPGWQPVPQDPNATGIPLENRGSVVPPAMQPVTDKTSPVQTPPMAAAAPQSERGGVTEFYTPHGAAR